MSSYCLIAKAPLPDASWQISLVLEKNISKVFAVYIHGGYLGHVAWTFYTNFGSPFLRMLHILALIGPGVSEEMFKHCERRRQSMGIL